jgi:hypothetical protein
MIRARIEVGRHVDSVAETHEGIELTGRVRLHPGRPVDVVTRPLGAPVIRRAVVASWRIVALGSSGPIYRGMCHWE